MKTFNLREFVRNHLRCDCTEGMPSLTRWISPFNCKSQPLGIQDATYLNIPIGAMELDH